jgi:hypothetical protein
MLRYPTIDSCRSWMLMPLPYDPGLGPVSIAMKRTIPQDYTISYTEDNVTTLSIINQICIQDIKLNHHSLPTNNMKSNIGR